MRNEALYVEGMSHSGPIPAAKICGNLLFSSLITGADAETKAMPEALDAQIGNMIDQMRRIMAAANGSVEHIAKVTIWLNDRADRKFFNEPWERLFPDPAVRPARVTLNRDLGGGKKIEAEIFAVLPAA